MWTQAAPPSSELKRPRNHCRDFASWERRAVYVRTCDLAWAPTSMAEDVVLVASALPGQVQLNPLGGHRVLPGLLVLWGRPSRWRHSPGVVGLQLPHIVVHGAQVDEVDGIRQQHMLGANPLRRSCWKYFPWSPGSLLVEYGPALLVPSSRASQSGPWTAFNGRVTKDCVQNIQRSGHSTIGSHGRVPGPNTHCYPFLFVGFHCRSSFRSPFQSSSSSALPLGVGSRLGLLGSA